MGMEYLNWEETKRNEDNTGEETKCVDGGSTSSIWGVPKEIQDLIERKNINSAKGSTLTDIWRRGTKPGTSTVYDLERLFTLHNEK